MTKREYLLTCLMEEAAEIVQEAAKCIRFGDFATWPGYEGTPLVRLFREIVDFTVTAEMTAEVLPELDVPDGELTTRVKAKKEKLEQMMAVSRNLGALEPE